jgi:N-acetylmuramoyl-L-alanine amidase
MRQGRPPALWMMGWLNWQARQIKDPVARLYFLRRTSRIGGMRPGNARRIAGYLAAVAACALLIIPIASTTKQLKASAPRDLHGETRRTNGKAERTAGRTDIWLVDQTSDYEIYSNGLRIEVKGAVTNQPRRYMPLERARPETWSLPPPPEAALRTAPAGIVYHTTESELAPFRASQNHTIQYLGKNLLSYIRHRKSYHYLIDRYGRVNRVVEEDRVANHAGWSVFADGEWIYVNLNHSFLGIAFEAQTRPEGEAEPINEAQIRAGQMLTGMLRAKYDIPARNCTTHGQVSVNPDNFKIGAHTDLTQGFPYAEFGLPDNYSQPPGSILLFGFSYDDVYEELTGPRLRAGLQQAEDQLRKAASSQHQPLSQYKANLHRRYRETIEVFRKLYSDEHL